MAKKTITVADLQTVIKDLEGDNVKTANKEGTAMVDLTVRSALRKALNGQYQDEMGMVPGSPMIDPDTKWLRYNLAGRIWNADKNVEFDEEELDQIRICAGKGLSPEAMGYIYNLLGIQPKKKK